MTRLRVACIQWKLEVDMYRNPDRVLEKADDMVAAAGAMGPKDVPLLVAFPEDIGTPFLFCDAPETVWKSRTLESAVKGLIRTHWVAVVLRRLRGASWTDALGARLAPGAERLYTETFSTVARRHGVYLVAGSALLPDAARGPVYNVSYLFGPDGRVVGRQKKVHLIDIEGPEGLGLGAAPATSLEVVALPWGKVGVAICHDAFFDDVITRLSGLGMEVLVQPSANPGSWSKDQQVDWLRGSSAAVRAADGPRVAVNPMMVGELFDLTFEGQSAIFVRGAEARAGYEALGPHAGCVASVRPNVEGVAAAEVFL